MENVDIHPYNVHVYIIMSLDPNCILYEPLFYEIK